MEDVFQENFSGRNMDLSKTYSRKSQKGITPQPKSRAFWYILGQFLCTNFLQEYMD